MRRWITIAGVVAGALSLGGAFALAAGLHKTLDEGRFQRLLVSRPIFPMGRDIGYLPGDVEQKLNPWMQPIFDNLAYLLSTRACETPRILR